MKSYIELKHPLTLKNLCSEIPAFYGVNGEDFGTAGQTTDDETVRRRKVAICVHRITKARIQTRTQYT